MNEAGGARAWILAVLAATGLGLGALIGIGCAIGANACPFTDDPGITATEGADIWVATCAACHGTDGAGSARAPQAPSLIGGESATLTLAQLIAKIERGSPGLMPRFKGHLSPEQIEGVAAHVVDLREGT